MQITEPVTMLTDYALGVASLYFAISLLAVMNDRNRVTGRLWVIGFISGSVAAFIGGTYHGFPLYVSPSGLRELWNITIYSIGASGAFMVSGVLASSIRKDDESRAWLLSGIVMTMAGFAIQLTGFRSHQDFNHNDAYHMIQIAGLYLFFRGARLLEDRLTV
ncbi:MAG TPA: hypothetical protein VE422_24205 [Terriglobia bacterium]|nr:hypothetical protein [Terriglobia bacterium]